jgi:CHAD domain-containing protein
MVRRAVRSLDRSVRAASKAEGEARDLLLHEVRKSAKQARYAAESTIPVLGKPAKAFAAAATRLQEVLGEHQDSIVATQRLRVLAEHAHVLGESAFTYGVLHAFEGQRAARAQEQYDVARRAAKATPLRRWMR